MTQKQADYLQQELNSIEMAGLQALFSEFYSDYQNFEKPVKYGFFYCDGYLQSEDDANGEPLFFEGLKVSHLAKRKNGDLTYMILEDEDETQFLCEFNHNNGEWYLFNEEWSETVKHGKWGEVDEEYKVN